MQRLQLLFFATIAIAFWASGASAATYYVDQTAGSDSNPGTQAQPWKNCPGMNGPSSHTGGASLQPGDVVYLDRSDSWNVSSSSPSGTNSGGLNLKGGVKIIGDVWNPEGIPNPDSAGPGGRPLQAVLNVVGNIEAGIIRFDDDHPTIPTVIEGVEGAGNGYMCSGVDMNGRTRQGPLTGALKAMRRLYLHDMNANGSGGIFNYGMFIRATGTSPIANYEIIDCELQNSPRDGIANYPDGSAGIGAIRNVLIRGNKIHGKRNDQSYGEGHGIGIKGNISNIVVEYNHVFDIWSSAIYLSSNDSNEESDPIIRFNILQRTQDTSRPSSRGCLRFYGGRKAARVYGNIFLPDFEAGGATAIDLNGAATGIPGRNMAEIYNNTCYGSYITLANKGSQGVIVRNNLVVRSSSQPGAIQSTSGATLSNNVTGVVGSFSGFKNAANIPTGFVGDYGWNIQPNTDGLSLVGGAAVGAGLNLGSEFDVAINSVRRAGNWDVGAYQQGDVPLPESAPPAPSNLTISQN